MYVENQEPNLHQFEIDDIGNFYYCARSLPYFCGNLKLKYFSGIVDFLYSFGFDYNKLAIIRGDRKSGKSTLLNAVLLWMALFRKNQRFALLSYNHVSAECQLEQIKQWYFTLPPYMKLGVEFSKKKIEFENGNGIYTSSIRSNSLRGNSFNMMVVDEASSCPEAELVHFQDNIFPAISSGKNTQIIITGTSGQNVIFDRMLRDANTKTGAWSKFTPIELVRYV